MTNDQGRNEYVQPRIGVVYICDSNYHNITLYSMASIARSHKTPLSFFLLQSKYNRSIPISFQEFIASCNHTVTVCGAPTGIPPKGNNNTTKKHGHITETALLKAKAISRFSNIYEFILYIDSDTLAFANLRLDEIASFGEIAAVSLDLSIASGLDDPAIFERSKRHGLSPYYFNSGLMIINTRKWRETCAEERFSENFVRHQRCCPYFSVCPTHDQCVLNMTLGGDAKLLPVAWNVQKSALQTHSWENAIVRHYTGARKFIPIRPWTCDRREYALLQSISKECGLQPLNSTYDFGISYALNKIRRRKTVAKYERAISAINAALATIV